MGNNITNFIEETRKRWRKMPFNESVKMYYDLMEKINKSKKEKKYDEMIQYCQISLAFVEPLIIDFKIDRIIYNLTQKNFEKYFNSGMDPEVAAKLDFIKKHKNITANDKIKGMDEFKIENIPAISIAVKYYSAMGIKGQLENLREFVSYFDDLKPWKIEIEDHFNKLEIGEKIRKHIKENPGCLQKNLKKELDIGNGRTISTLIYLMNEYGIIGRKPSGKSYELYLTY